MTDTPELKCCPFCGGTARVNRDPCSDEWGAFLSIKCTKCGAQSREKYYSYGNDCPQFTQEARDDWNARADLDTPQWRSMDSAPKDGNRIVVASPTGSIWTVRWVKMRRVPDRWESSGLGAIHFEPTHWMPLPAAPDKQESKT